MKNINRVLSSVLVALVILTCFAACGMTPEEAILGSWKDSTGTMGYEFKEGNVCVINFPDVKVPILGYKYDGDVNGVYTIKESEDGTCYLTITYTIGSKSSTKNYTFTIDGSALTLTDMENMTQTILIKSEAETTAAPETTVAAETSAPVSE